MPEVFERNANFHIPQINFTLLSSPTLLIIFIKHGEIDANTLNSTIYNICNFQSLLVSQITVSCLEWSGHIIRKSIELIKNIQRTYWSPIRTRKRIQHFGGKFNSLCSMS